MARKKIDESLKEQEDVLGDSADDDVESEKGSDTEDSDDEEEEIPDFECRFETRERKFYWFNLFSRQTTWENPYCLDSSYDNKDQVPLVKTISS